MGISQGFDSGFNRDCMGLCGDLMGFSASIMGPCLVGEQTCVAVLECSCECVYTWKPQSQMIFPSFGVDMFFSVITSLWFD